METDSQQKITHLYEWLRSTRRYLARLIQDDDAAPKEIERVMKLESSIVKQIRQLQQYPSPSREGGRRAYV